MTDLLPFIVSGIATGSIYGLAATGLVLTYKTSGIFNFGYGALATAAAYVFYWLYVDLELDWKLAAFLSVFVLGPLMGLVMERIARQLTPQRTAWKIVGTVGLILIVQGLGTIKYGTDPLSVPQFLPKGTETFRVLDVNIGYDQLIITIISLLAVAALYALFRFTRLGIAMRAVVDDPDLLDIMGTSPITGAPHLVDHRLDVRRAVGCAHRPADRPRVRGADVPGRAGVRCRGHRLLQQHPTRLPGRHHHRRPRRRVQEVRPRRRLAGRPARQLAVPHPVRRLARDATTQARATDVHRGPPGAAVARTAGAALLRRRGGGHRPRPGASVRGRQAVVLDERADPDPAVPLPRPAGPHRRSGLAVHHRLRRHRGGGLLTVRRRPQHAMAARRLPRCARGGPSRRHRGDPRDPPLRPLPGAGHAGLRDHGRAAVLSPQLHVHDVRRGPPHATPVVGQQRRGLLLRRPGLRGGRRHHHRVDPSRSSRAHPARPRGLPGGGVDARAEHERDPGHRLLHRRLLRRRGGHPLRRAGQLRHGE